MNNEQAIHCLGVYADESVCEECDFYPDCTHETQSDMARLAISAIRKQIPKQIIHNPNRGRDEDWLCPSCGRFCSPYAKFCQSCGQALEKGEENG